jgi:hypothetical protein
MHDGLRRVLDPRILDDERGARSSYLFLCQCGSRYGIWFIFSPAFHKVLSRFSEGWIFAKGGH